VERLKKSKALGAKGVGKEWTQRKWKELTFTVISGPSYLNIILSCHKSCSVRATWLAEQKEWRLGDRTKGMRTSTCVRALPHFRIGVRKKLPFSAFTYCRMIQLPKKTIGCQRHLIVDTTIFSTLEHATVYTIFYHTKYWSYISIHEDSARVRAVRASP
jgi:hypothetical protein